MAVYGTGFFASGRLASIAFPRLHRDALCFFQTHIFSEIPYSAGIRPIRIEAQFVVQQFSEHIHSRIIAVDHKHFFRFFLKPGHPGKETLPVSMSGDARQHQYLRLYADRFTKQGHFRSAVHQRPPERALRLVADKEDGALFTPQVMLQMVLDPAGLAHAAGRQNDLRHPVVIDRT